MHSRRMRIVRRVTVGGGVGGWADTPSRQTPPIPFPMDKMTDASENIILPHTSYAGGNNQHGRWLFGFSVVTSCFHWSGAMADYQ